MGKITVKHFLNKKVKPKEDSEYVGYPVYVRITLSRKSTEIKSRYINYYIDIRSISIPSGFFDDDGTWYLSEDDFNKMSNYVEGNEFFALPANFVLTLEVEGFKLIYDYFFKIRKSDPGLKIFNEVADNVLYPVRRLVNNILVNIFIVDLRKSKKFKGLASIINANVDFDDLVESLENIIYAPNSSYISSFANFFHDHTEPLSKFLFIYDNFIQDETKYSRRRKFDLLLIQWVSEEYTEKFASYIKDYISKNEICFNPQLLLSYHTMLKNTIEGRLNR